MTETQAFLAEFAKTRSDAAFRELVARYLNLVYSTAFRLVGGDAHLAQDVSQTVFLHLVQKAHTLKPDSALGGWLHRDTCHVAATLMRSERRRQLRELKAASMNSASDHSEANLAQLAPVLDEAINQLGALDRAAILLRFYEQRDLRSVGEALGASENAAQKRITRALEQLRLLLKRRGVALSVVSLGSLLAAHAVTAAPTALVATVSTAALAGATHATATSLSLLKLMATANLKTAAVSAVILASVLTPLLLQHQASARIRDQDFAINQQSNQLAQISADNQRLTLLAKTNNSHSSADPQLSELLKLRSEVGRLRNTVAEMSPTNPMSRDEKLAYLKNKSATRVARLKEWLAAHPNESIPELRLINEDTWIQAASDLDDDDDFENAMVNLRENAEMGPLLQLAEAAQAYAKQNNGQIPSDLSQVTPYLHKPMDADIMQQYQIVPSGALATNPLSGSWVVTPVASPNPDLEAREIMGPNQQGRITATFIQRDVTNRWTVLQQ